MRHPRLESGDVRSVLVLPCRPCGLGAGAGGWGEERTTSGGRMGMRGRGHP